MRGLSFKVYSRRCSITSMRYSILSQAVSYTRDITLISSVTAEDVQQFIVLGRSLISRPLRTHRLAFLGDSGCRAFRKASLLVYITNYYYCTGRATPSGLLSLFPLAHVPISIENVTGLESYSP